MTDPPSACPLPRALRFRMAGAPAAAGAEGEEEGPATASDSRRNAPKGWRGSSNGTAKGLRGSGLVTFSSASGRWLSKTE